MKNIPFKDDKALKQGAKRVMESPSLEVFQDLKGLSPEQLVSSSM